MYLQLEHAFIAYLEVTLFPAVDKLNREDISTVRKFHDHAPLFHVPDTFVFAEQSCTTLYLHDNFSVIFDGYDVGITTSPYVHPLPSCFSSPLTS